MPDDKEAGEAPDAKNELTSDDLTSEEESPAVDSTARPDDQVAEDQVGAKDQSSDDDPDQDEPQPPEQAEEIEDDDDDSSLDLDTRTLCSDGNCIGVIGPNGRCKECGKAHTKKKRSSPTPKKPPSDDGARDLADDIDSSPNDGDDLDFSKRKLCSDGNCIGVIGANGCCKECGKPFTGDPQ